jgi:hypothetical protein
MALVLVSKASSSKTYIALPFEGIEFIELGLAF